MKIISVSWWQPSGGGRVWSEFRVSLYIFTDFHLHTLTPSSRWVSAQSETRNFANDLYIMKIYGATRSEIWKLLRKLLKRKWVEWTQCVLKCGGRNAIWIENEWVERKEKWRMFELKLDKTYFLKNMFEIVDIFSLVISLCRCIIHTLPVQCQPWMKEECISWKYQNIDSKHAKLYHIFPMHNILSSVK